MTDEVKFTNEQWDALAEAAEVFAIALDEERKLMKDVVSKNWAGDCGEGTGTIENLRQLLHGEGTDSFAGAVKSEADYMRSIAAQCRSAKAGLASEDASNTLRFRSAP